MQSLSTVMVAAVTWALTGITKNKFVKDETKNRKVLVKLLAAMFALLASVGYAIASGGPLETGLVVIFVDSLIAFLGSVGIYGVLKK